MTWIRVLMIATPRLQTDLIATALADEPAIELVGQVGTDAAAAAVASSGAQLVITGLDGDDHPPAPVLSLLALHPSLKVLGVSSSGGRAVLYELRPAARSLGELSPRMLAEAIIDATRAGGPETPRGSA